MPKAKAKVTSITQKRLKVLEHIQATGVKTENEFLSMTAQDMVNSFPDISTEDFKIMCEIQCSVRDNNLFAYLCGSN